MCIIAVYNQQSKLDRATIERMVRKNPDGIGIAFNDGRRVTWAKGYTDAGDAYKIIKHARDNGAKDIIFHARIATSGGVSAEKCHPFPLTSDIALLNKPYGTTRGAVVFHNGVFAIDIERGLSDTQTFVKNCLAPIRDDLARGRLGGLVEMAVKGSRLAILYPNRVDLFGDWHKGDGDGVQYSNTGFRDWASYSYSTANYWRGRDGKWRYVDINGEVRLWDEKTRAYRAETDDERDADLGVKAKKTTAGAYLRGEARYEK